MLCRHSIVCSYVQSLENRIANLEQLLCEACSLWYTRFTPLTPQQHSGRGGTGDSPSITYGRALADSHPLGDQYGLSPLPASVYSKPEDMDPLVLLSGETSDDDDQFFSLTEANLGTPRPSDEPAGEHTSRFYGKSSLLAFTSWAFDERAKTPPTNRTQMCRQEFWDTPDVTIPIS